MELQLRLEFLRQLENRFGFATFELSKVHLCEKTNAIRVRFRNDTIGLIGGVVKPNFSVKSTMTIHEIEAEITIDKIGFNDFIRAIQLIPEDGS